MRSRIDQALDEIQKNDISLEDALKSREVDVRRRGQNGISFAFVDNEGKKRISRGQRLGTKYERKSIDDYEQGIQQQRQQAIEPRNEADPRGVHAVARRQAIRSVREHQRHLERSLSEARSRAERTGKRKRALAELVKAIQQTANRSLAILKRLKDDSERLKADLKLLQDRIITRGLSVIEQKYEADTTTTKIAGFLRNPNNATESRLELASKILENTESDRPHNTEKDRSVTPPKPFIKKKAKER